MSGLFGSEGTWANPGGGGVLRAMRAAHKAVRGPATPASADAPPSAQPAEITSIAPNPNAIESAEEERKRKKKFPASRETVLSQLGANDSLG